MSNRLMSSRTVELMLLLYDDGVDGNELKALVDSAFKDGATYMVKNYDDPESSGNL